mmetsp:Transcript_30496/g.74067  ORF Transcript_30496/g.74067 Transcript_30496/m.74067 type:complete len:237 (-) Transcript_30496:248-958(-)|eukprot:CAMPEP_0113507278 /NCGR_PEP_ID=MMETSP0014_2-20120614/36375_1 /TAXON_ID=2857 /ORGANISM="Nitzschia sp." /LENGTH=236 /DNA_ID=CAMNT_0000402867 /DNA_START=259 /DNA_END=969 /DNA_ORIENTATION=+ /assembly_acc=CAM_ASM_000159
MNSCVAVSYSSKSPHPETFKFPRVFPSNPQSTRPRLLFLFLTGLVQDRLCEGTTTVMDLDDVPVGGQFTTTTQLDIILAVVLREAPLEGFQDLLPSGEFELSTTDGLDDVRLVGVLRTDAQQDLTDVDPGGDPDRLPVRVTHPARQTVGTRTTQHLIRPQDVERVGTDTDVVPVLPDVLRQVLVDSDTARLQGLRRDLLLLVAHEVGDEREQIDGRRLGTDVENPDLRFRYTTTIP